MLQQCVTVLVWYIDFNGRPVLCPLVGKKQGDGKELWGCFIDPRKEKVEELSRRVSLSSVINQDSKFMIAIVISHNL